ncbi:FtsX-like permease family protein [Serinibacter salmoneus]|uniref:FtsX-like permease family protein n=1 Tax=Serinibacter salmoneus TaxID=556530 RepID=A0A2A9D122_9MICO|nr:FtsX-like permease family protein [Serinibacter salmoneus]PFG20398.1 FtsX-like permease family protein [Serinibacter salmoneus]
MRFLARRARAQAALLAVLAALVALVTATAAAGSGLVVQRSDAITTTELASRQGAPGALVLQTRAGQDPQAQDDALVTLLGDLIAASGGTPQDGAALDVTRAWVGESLTLQREDAAAGAAFLATAADLAGRADLIDGRWLSEPGASADEPGVVPALLPVSAADRAGLGVGDVVALGREGALRLQVVGTFAAREPSAPLWTAADSAQLTGEQQVTGPFVVAEATTIPGDPYLRWTITPSGAPLVSDGAAPLAAALAALPAALEATDDFAPRGLTETGTLADTLAELAAAAADARAVTGVALVMLAILGLLCLSQVARLLARARAAHSRIMLARGAAPGRLVAMEVAETGVLAALAVALGAALGLAVAPGGGLVALVALPLAWAAIALPAVTGILRPEQAGRGTTLVRGVSAGLIVLLAALSTWRLLSLVGSSSWTALEAALALPAPGLAVLACALVLLVALAPVWAAMDRIAVRAPVTPALGLFSVARTSRSQAVPVLLLAAAVGTTGVAATYAASAGAARADLLAAQSGADARIQLPPRGAVSAAYPPRDVAPLADVPGVTATARVNRVTGDVGGVEAELLAVPASLLPDVMALPDGTGADPDALAAAITPAPPAAGGLDGAREVTLSLQQSGGTTLPAQTTAQLSVLAWFVDAAGAVRWQESAQEVSFGDNRVSIPQPAAGESLLALDLTARVPAPVQELSLALAAVGSGAEQGGSPTGWRGTTWSAPPGDPVLTASWSTTVHGRLLPPAPEALPAVLSPTLAQALDASVGDALEFSGAGYPLAIEVAAVAEVPGVPGFAVLVDRDGWVAQTVAFSRGVPDADEIWIALADPVTAAVGEDPEGGGRPALERQARALGGTALWPDLAAAGTAVGTPAFALVAGAALVLAVVGLLAAAAVSVRDRRAEVLTLRAIGMSARGQARARALEPAVVTLAGILCGLVVAAAVSALVTPALVRLSVPAVVSVTVHVHPWWLATAVAVLGAGGVVTALVVARTVTRQARDTAHREETR